MFKIIIRKYLENMLPMNLSTYLTSVYYSRPEILKIMSLSNIFSCYSQLRHPNASVSVQHHCFGLRTGNFCYFYYYSVQKNNISVYFVLSP